MKYNLLLIGSGVWGQKYISTLSNFPNVALKAANRDNWKILIDKNPDGVIVCTPPQSHIEIAEYALRKNIPTMIEKPLALSLKEAEKLKQYTAPILVNHIHLFSRDYQKLKEDLIGKNITQILTRGTGNGEPRDYSELWDYGPHDVAMILDLMDPKLPHSIECTKYTDRAFNIKMEFDSFASYSTIGYDTEKCRNLEITVGVDKKKYDGVKSNDLPLANALEVFIDSINGYPDYRLGLDLPLKVIRILQECQTLIDNKT